MSRRSMSDDCVGGVTAHATDSGTWLTLQRIGLCHSKCSEGSRVGRFEMFYQQSLPGRKGEGSQDYCEVMRRRRDL